jgi:hypothetical protein
VKNKFPENSIWNTAVPLLSYSCMFQVEICSQQLEICKSMCMFIILTSDFKSKSQNIWQQIILLSRTVMQRICTWPKIWTLSGRLSLMRNVQLMKKNKNIFRVYHIRIIAKKIGSHDMKQTDSSIIIVRNVYVLTCISFALLYGTTELSAVKYFAICS